MTGTQIASPTGDPPVRVTGNLGAVPRPDGTQFVTTEWDVVDGSTEVTVSATSSSEALYGVRVPGYFREAKPSPADPKVLMGTVGESTVGEAEIVFIDMAAIRELRRLPADGPVTWLPDGRYLRVALDGAMYAAVVEGAEQLVGRVDPPSGHTVRGLWVNRQGSRIAFLLERTASPVNEIDLWLADIDGSGLERFTATKITSYARWSPDGNAIAFDVDTGFVCADGGCVGQCELRYAPAQSRGVTALAANEDAYPFTVKNSFGSNRTLGCELLAWTD